MMKNPAGFQHGLIPKKGVMVDTKNPDESLKGRPLVGSKIIWGFKPKGNRWTGGKIYNPKDGNIYKSKLALTEDGKLKVKGCVGPICKSLLWTRAEKRHGFSHDINLGKTVKKAAKTPPRAICV